MKPFRRAFRLRRTIPDPDGDVRDEIRFYLDMRTDELIGQGMSPDEAARMARAAFGDPGSYEDRCRTIVRDTVRRRQRTEWWRSVWRDVRYVARDWIRRPAFATTALLTLAICIGANAAVFSVVYSIVLRPLPFPDADRLVTLYNSYPAAGIPRAGSSVGDFIDRDRRIEALRSVALFNAVSSALGDPGSVQNTFSMDVTPSFFDVLGVPAALGRTFTSADAMPRQARVVISHGLWQERFEGDAGAVGRTLRINRIPHTVIGVMPPDFRLGDWEARLWLPIVISPDRTLEELYDWGGYQMIGRMAPEAGLARVQSQIDALNAALVESLPPDLAQRATAAGYATRVVPVREDLVQQVRPSLYLLWGGVLFVLVIGAVNLSTLLLARNTTRMRELATRAALGAGRWRLVRQLVTESLALAAMGGILGLVLGRWSLNLLQWFDSYEIPRVHEVGLHAGAIVFTAALIGLVGLVAGVLPVLAIPRHDLHAVLRAGTLSKRSGRRAATVRNGLVAAQIAVAFVLLAGAALLVSSVRSLMAVDPGFRTDRVLAGAVTIPWDRYPTLPTRDRFVEDLLSAISDVPGVTGAAIASQLPLSESADQGLVTPESPTAPSAAEVVVPFRTIVSPEYFAVMGIPVRDGRLFTTDDARGSEPVIIVDETLARRHWPGPSPVGERVRLGDPAREPVWHTVVGVVGSTVQNDLAAPEPNGAFFLPHYRSGITFTRLAIATEVAPRSIAQPVAAAIGRLEPEMSFFWVQSMDDAVRERLLYRRLPMTLLLGFAGIALFLATVGVYGVLAHAVTQRAGEIGLRLALGCTRSGIYRLILGQGLPVVAIGVGIGMVVALTLTRMLSGFLYGIEPTDAGVFVSITLVVSAAAGVACLVPTRRAERVNPVRVFFS